MKNTVEKFKEQQSNSMKVLERLKTYLENYKKFELNTKKSIKYSEFLYNR